MRNKVKRAVVTLIVCSTPGAFLGGIAYNEASKKLKNKEKLIEEWKEIEEKPVKIYKGKWELGGITLQK